MKRYASYFSFGELEFLSIALEDYEAKCGFHERNAIRKLRDRITRTQETILADEALDAGMEK